MVSQLGDILSFPFSLPASCLHILPPLPHRETHNFGKWKAREHLWLVKCFPLTFYLEIAKQNHRVEGLFLDTVVSLR